MKVVRRQILRHLYPSAFSNEPTYWQDVYAALSPQSVYASLRCKVVSLAEPHSYRLLTAETRVHSQAVSCGICGEKCCTETRSFPSNSIFSCQPHSTRLHAHQFLSQTLNNFNSWRRPYKTRFVKAFWYCTYFSFAFCSIRICHIDRRFFFSSSGGLLKFLLTNFVI